MQRPKTKLLMVASVLAVLAIVIGGTAAYGYFFSGQTVENNQIRAGEIRLQLNGGGAVVPIDLNNGVNDIMPGEHGTEGNWMISNIGNNAGTLFIQLVPDEWDVNFGDVLLSTFWLDRDSNGVWSTGDSYFNPDGTFVNYQTGDGVAIPAAAFQKMNRWTTALINTMDVPVGDLGRLEFSWLLPAEVVDTPEKPIMGKSCNFDLLVQIDQPHDPLHTLSGSLSGHSSVTVAMYNGGFLTSTYTTAPTDTTYSISVPAISGYTAVFTWSGGSFTVPSPIDLTFSDQAADLPA